MADNKLLGSRLGRKSPWVKQGDLVKVLEGTDSYLIDGEKLKENCNNNILNRIDEKCRINFHFGQIGVFCVLALRDMPNCFDQHGDFRKRQMGAIWQR